MEGGMEEDEGEEEETSRGEPEWPPIPPPVVGGRGRVLGAAIAPEQEEEFIFYTQH